MPGTELTWDEKPFVKPVVIGLGLAITGFVGNLILKRIPVVKGNLNQLLKSLSSMKDTNKFYKGGFESTMTKREACLILGISPTSTRYKVKEAHKRIMLLNHPDKGGSPYLAAKIIEAKDCIEKHK